MIINEILTLSSYKNRKKGNLDNINEDYDKKG